MSQPPADRPHPPAPRGGAARARRRGWMCLLALLSMPLLWPAGTAPARAADGWEIDCPSADPAAACIARRAAEAPSTGDATAAGGAAGGFALRLERAPGGVALAFEAPFPRPDDRRAMQWDVDGQASLVLPPDAFAPHGDIARLHVIDAGLGARLLAALAAGRSLRISYLDALGEAHEVTFDLAGSAEALARVRPDAASPAVVPPRDAARLQPPSRDEAVASLGLPYALVDRHWRTSDCEALDSPGLARAEILIAVLSPVATLYALPYTAGSGAGGTWRLYVRDSGEIGGIESLVFAVHDPRFGWIGTDLLPQPAFDRTTGELSVRYVGRSDRHCGYRATWRWQEHAFALKELASPRDCRDAEAPARWITRHPAP